MVDNIPHIKMMVNMDNLHSKLRSMLALLSPKGLKALQRYIPPSCSVGFFIVNVSKNRCFLALMHSWLILGLSLIGTSFLNHVISGIGFASKMHSITKLSPSCFIVGFFGNLGGIPSGIFVFVPETCV